MFERSTLVPIKLSFSGVSPEEAIEVSLNTPGVTWSIGPSAEDEIGLSLNSMAPTDSLPACIHRVELGESVLAVQTSEKNATVKAAGSEFSIDAFMLCKHGVKQIEGYCTINPNAKIVVSLPLQQPVEWRRGPITAALMEKPPEFEEINLVVRGLSIGNSISLRLQPRSFLGRSVKWSLGPSRTLGCGLEVFLADGGAAGFPHISMNASAVRVAYQSQSTAASTGSLKLRFCLLIDELPPPESSDRLSGSDSILLLAEGPSGVSVMAQIGMHLPKMVVGSFTPFRI